MEYWSNVKYLESKVRNGNEENLKRRNGETENPRDLKREDSLDDTDFIRRLHRLLRKCVNALKRLLVNEWMFRCEGT